MIDILARHRGPYRLEVTRPFTTKAGFFRTEWLPGIVESEDVGDEALALLSDPRDTIVSVGVWSEREQQFVTTIRGERNL